MSEQEIRAAEKEALRLCADVASLRLPTEEMIASVQRQLAGENDPQQQGRLELMLIAWRDIEELAAIGSVLKPAAVEHLPAVLPASSSTSVFVPKG